MNTNNPLVSAEAIPSAEDPPFERLQHNIKIGYNYLAKPEFSGGFLKIWVGTVRSQLRRIYGPESEAVRLWGDCPEGPIAALQARQELQGRLAYVERLVVALAAVPQLAMNSPKPNRVFIGHGRSPVWRELKDFLWERLQLPTEEFNREPVAGISTTERLQQMLEISNFAFLLMTAEDEHADATLHARVNVIHEVGLFQGRLGNRRAIVLMEEGCQSFSNINGLTYIGFPKGRVGSVFEDVRRTLEREGLIVTN